MSKNIKEIQKYLKKESVSVDDHIAILNVYHDLLRDIDEVEVKNEFDDGGNTDGE